MTGLCNNIFDDCSLSYLEFTDYYRACSAYKHTPTEWECRQRYLDWVALLVSALHNPGCAPNAIDDSLAANT